MDVSYKPSAHSDALILWAIIGSIMLHATIAVIVPNFHFDAPKPKPKELTIELPKPEPVPIAAPEPPEPIVQETPPPAPKPKPKPIKKKPKPKPIPKPEPVIEPEPLLEPPQEIVQETPPPVIAAAPVAESEPTFVVPEPTPPPPPPPPPSNTNAINAAKGQFRQRIQDALQKNHRYPKMAKTRGQQGKVLVKIKFDKLGNLINVEIIESSGYRALDKAALATVSRANLASLFPDELIGVEDYSFTTPIKFTLNNI